GERVEIRHQPVALLDEAAADGEMIGAVDPGFRMGRIVCGMVAEDRREGCELVPPREQLWAGAADEPADIAAAIGEAGQPEVLQLLDAQPQMVPGRAVVARPGRRIALAARIRCTR